MNSNSRARPKFSLTRSRPFWGTIKVPRSEKEMHLRGSVLENWITISISRRNDKQWLFFFLYLWMGQRKLSHLATGTLSWQDFVMPDWVWCRATPFRTQCLEQQLWFRYPWAHWGENEQDVDGPVTDDSISINVFAMQTNTTRHRPDVHMKFLDY